jgi:hypothetical protein
VPKSNFSILDLCPKINLSSYSQAESPMRCPLVNSYPTRLNIFVSDPNSKINIGNDFLLIRFALIRLRIRSRSTSIHFILLMRENLISKRHPNKMFQFILFCGLSFIRTSVRSVPCVGLSQRVSCANQPTADHLPPNQLVSSPSSTSRCTPVSSPMPSTSQLAAGRGHQCRAWSLP